MSAAGTLRVVLHLALLAGVTVWGGYRLRAHQAERALPVLRPEPLAIRPLYDDPTVVDDASLHRVLGRLGLPARGRETSIGHVDHALRLWGPGVDFGDRAILSGDKLRLLVTSHRFFLWTYGRSQPPLLVDAGPGVRVRALEGPASSSHVDHTPASLAEVGTPLDFPVYTSTRRTDFRAVVEQSLRDFSLNQAEYEWSALTYVLLLPPVRRWTTSEGQEMTFDRLADRLLREELPQGVCSANHRLHTLVMFLRVDDRMAAEGEERILSPQARRRLLDFLRGVTATLVRHQHPDGFWNGRWTEAAPATSAPTDEDDDRLSDRLIVTGHVLEWWSLAPEELLPPRPVVVAAGRWLVATVDRLSAAEVAENYTFLSHVGRALALWRGVLPGETSTSATAASEADGEPGGEP